VRIAEGFTVPTPPDETFAYLADLEHEVRWNPELFSARTPWAPRP